MNSCPTSASEVPISVIWVDSDDIGMGTYRKRICLSRSTHTKMYVASDSFVFRMDRRTFVRLSGLSAAGFAGCVGNDGDGEPGGDQTQGADGEPEDMNETQNQDTDTEMDGNNGLVTVTAGEETVDEAVGRIEGDIDANENLSLIEKLDHRENAATVDMELPPTVVLMFGNPAAGTPLMQESRTVGVDLPQKMLVWEDEDEVKITYNDPEHLAERHGIEGMDELLGNIRNALDALSAGEMG